MKYLKRYKRRDDKRNYDIDIAIEGYLDEQRKHIFELLDEIETYPAGLQKQLFNYKFNYDDEQEMFSREIIHMYRTGETDPRFLLNKLMKEAYENPSSDDDDDPANIAMRQKRPKAPNLSCFKKKEDDAANWINQILFGQQKVDKN